MKVEKFSDLVGKTIVSATHMGPEGYSDKGHLKLEFSDGSSTVLRGSYTGEVGNVLDEYAEIIYIDNELPKEWGDDPAIPLVPVVED